MCWKEALWHCIRVQMLEGLTEVEGSQWVKSYFRDVSGREMIYGGDPCPPDAALLTTPPPPNPPAKTRPRLTRPLRNTGDPLLCKTKIQLGGSLNVHFSLKVAKSVIYRFNFRAVKKKTLKTLRVTVFFQRSFRYPVSLCPHPLSISSPMQSFRQTKS